MLLSILTTMVDSEYTTFALSAANSTSNGEIITSTSDFQTFWENLAGQFKDNDLVIFDTSR